jgi:2-(1,2-epoxy-1,2-dihydrophenyl)acetyl-CoA isomerase
MKFKTILFSLDAGVAEIAIDRPEANNSINLECARELMHAAIMCGDDRSVRSILMTGTGASFCPGGDLKSFHAAGDDLPSHVREVTTYLHAAVSRFTRGDAPIVTAVNGVAAGAGMSLACLGDIIVAGVSARFTAAYTGVGLCPDGALTYFLPRMIGVKRAMELVLTNAFLTAEDAAEWGIVARVVPDEELIVEARAIAAKLADGPTLAFGAARRLLHTGQTHTLETQMELESRALAEMTGTQDARKAIASFVEKRRPRFKGK